MGFFRGLVSLDLWGPTSGNSYSFCLKPFDFSFFNVRSTQRRKAGSSCFENCEIFGVLWIHIKNKHCQCVLHVIIPSWNTDQGVKSLLRVLCHVWVCSWMKVMCTVFFMTYASYGFSVWSFFRKWQYKLIRSCCYKIWTVAYLSLSMGIWTRKMVIYVWTTRSQGKPCVEACSVTDVQIVQLILI